MIEFALIVAAAPLVAGLLAALVPRLLPTAQLRLTGLALVSELLLDGLEHRLHRGERRAKVVTAQTTSSRRTSNSLSRSAAISTSRRRSPTTRGFAEHQGGRIWHEIRPGGGASISFKLPAAA